MGRTKQLVFFIVISLLSNSCIKSSDGWGLGVVHIETDSTHTVEFYKFPDSKHLFFTINLVYEEGTVSINTSEEFEGRLQEFNPLFMNSNQGIVVLKVTDVSEDWLRVVSNSDTNTQYWLKNVDYVHDSWETFLSSIYKVRPVNKGNNSVRKSPNGELLPPIKFENTCFLVTDILGDWIRIENQYSFCDDPSVSRYPYSGFIKWREDEKIVITFSL